MPPRVRPGEPNPQETPVKVNQVYVNVNSHQPEVLTAFYKDIVGLEPRPEMGEQAFSLGPSGTFGIDGHSDVHAGANEPARVLIDLFVDNVKAERERMESLGATFIRKEGPEMWGGITSTFVDPDGNYGQLMQLPSGS